jgi:hypothetical protein
MLHFLAVFAREFRGMDQQEGAVCFKRVLASHRLTITIETQARMRVLLKVCFFSTRDDFETRSLTGAAGARA